MLDFLELVKKRQSVRKYLNKPVEQDKLQRCLEAARLSPSACNSQPWSFIVVDESELKEKVSVLTYDSVISFNKFVPQAPVLVIFVMEKAKVVARLGGLIKKMEYPKIDIGIAAENFCLQATAEGLGTCMLGWFKEKPIKRLLNIPDSKKIGLIISLGYSPENYKLREKSRKKLEDIVRYNSYSSQKSD
jgi:nitroreductase